MVQCRKFIYVRFWSYFANTSFAELFTSRTDKVNWFTMLLISDSNSQLSSYVSLWQRFPVLQWKNLRVEVYVTAPQGIKSIYFLQMVNNFIKYQKENSLQLNCEIQDMRENNNLTTLVQPLFNNFLSYAACFLKFIVCCQTTVDQTLLLYYLSSTPV